MPFDLVALQEAPNSPLDSLFLSRGIIKNLQFINSIFYKNLSSKFTLYQKSWI